MKRRIIALLLALMTVLGVFPVTALAAATVPDALGEVDIYHSGEKMNYLSINDKAREQTYTYYNYKAPDGSTKQIPAYCVNPNTAGVPQSVPAGTGIQYLADEKASDPKVTGTVASGYPHRSLSDLGLNSPQEAYYATKMALWCYLLSNWDINDLEINPGCSDQAAAQRVLAAAKKIFSDGMGWTVDKNPRLTATPDKSEPYPVTVNGTDYLQQVYTVESETWVDGEWVEVAFADPGAVPAGTRITDMSDKDITKVGVYTPSGTNFTGQFKLLIPADAPSGSVQLTFAATVHNFAVFYAVCQETGKYGPLQRYMVDTDPRQPVKADASTSWTTTAVSPDPGPDPTPDPTPTPTPTTPPGDLQIIKRETGTLALLDGAIFEVVGPNGDTIGMFSTVNGIVSVPNLVPGNYTVYERIPPKFHLLSKNPAQNVTVREGETATLTFDNDPFGELRVEKYSDTGEGLAGVVVQIKHIESGRTYSGTTEPGGAVQFSELTPGAYEVREISGIKGWKADLETIQTVNVVTGQVSTVSFTNKELPGLRIEKYDSSNNQVLSGITFRIWKDGEVLGDYRTGELGEILLTDLQPGTYVVQEVAADDEHLLDGMPQQVELHAGDGIKSLVFFNAKKPGIHLIKVDSADPSKRIPNAKFSIRSVAGDYGPQEFITDENGEIDLSKLPVGAYVVTELECPGYIIDEAQRIIQLDGNESVEFVFANTIKPTLHLIKTSADGSRLPGVTFRIAKVEDGTHYLDRTTDANGEIIVSDLEPGVYSVVETATPDDHIPDPREHHVELFPGKTSTISIENQKRPNLIVYKKDADTGEPIPGTVFQVKAADGHSVDQIRTDSEGKAELRNLLPGVYEIIEKSVPAAWLQDAPGQTVTLYPNRDHTVNFRNHKKPSLTVNKVDSITGNPIKGAKFEVWYGSNNTTTGELNSLGTHFSDANGQFTLDLLRDGWYKITELEPAAGFTIKEPATQEVYIKGGEHKVLTFENTPLNAIIVEKYDSVIGEALPGCTFQLKYLGGASGTGGTAIGEKVTGKNGTAIWTGLQPGTYIVEEVDPADGYSIIQESETIFLADSGEQSVVTVRFTNAPDGMLLIRKVCSVNPSVTLQDAEFKVLYADGTVIGDSNGVFRTDENGEIRITGLKPGKSVVVTETRAPAGFILDTQSQTVQVKEGRTVSLTFKNQPKGAIIVQKRDSQTGQPLPGAQFRITTAAGCEVGLDGVIGTSTLTQNGIFETDSNGEIRISNLAPGAYVLTEIKAPAGYVMDTPSTNVVIGANGDTQTVVVTNSPKGGLVIEKYDSVTKKPLRGAQFKVTNANGELTPDNEGLTSSNGLYTTDINGQIVLSKLLPGTYVVTEEKAPENYRKDPTPQTVVVNASDTQAVRFYNDPLCNLTILKRDAVTKKPLAGAAFTVRDSEGRAVGPNNGSYLTGSDGTIVVTGLEPDATIVVSESKAPTGYILNETPQTIVVRSGAVNRLVFENEPATTLIIRKFIEGTENEPLSGVAFKLVDGSGAAVGPDDGIFYTDHAGEIVVDGLEPGTTVVAREIKTVEGFVLDATPQDILIKAGEKQELVFWNKRDCSLTILKQSTDKTPLTGAVFHVTDEDGGAIGTNNGRYTTDRNGLITITGLQPGQIIIVTEEKAPDGYVKDPTPKTIKIQQGVANSLTFENARAGSLVINKRSSADKKTPLEGVTFKITTTDGKFLPDENGKVSSNGIYYTGENGQIVLKGVVGSLVVTEVQSIPGYTISGANRTQTVVVNPDDTQTLYFYNDPLCSLTIEKYLETETGNLPLKGVTFLVTDSSGAVIGPNNGEYITGDDGRITIDNLEPGTTITAKEIKVPEGVILDTLPKSTQIKAGEGQTLRFVNKKAGTLVIRKLDKITKAPLAGAEFELTYAEGGFVDDANGHLSSKGRYTTNDMGEIRLSVTGTVVAKEVTPSPGYVIDATSQIQTVTVNPADTQTIVFYNEPLCSLTLSKKDSVSGKPVPGTEFTVRDSSGAIIGKYTTGSDGTVTVTGLVPGSTVVVTETKVPKGYVLNPTPQTIVVKNGTGNSWVSGGTVNSGTNSSGGSSGSTPSGGTSSGTVSGGGTNGGNNLDFENDPTTILTIQKFVDGTNNEPMKGVEFLVTDGTGAVVGPNNGYYTTDKDGRITIPNLEPGTTIIARETKTLEGFLLDSTPQTIVIKVGEGQHLTFWNKKAGGLIVNKVDAETKKPLAGVKFKITYADGTNVDMDGGKVSSNGLYTTDTNGQIKILGITGTVIVEEIETLPGYVIDPNAKSQTVVINANDAQTITFTNSCTGGVELIKVDESDKTKRLPGVTFEIRKTNDALVDTVTTDKNGRVALDLDAGSYYAVEIEAAEGYKLDDTPTPFTVEDGKPTKITITNKKFSGILLHKTDSITGKGISGVTFLLYDSTNKPIGQYTTDNTGYIYIDDLTVSGKYFLREMENKGYLVDTEMKTVYVTAGETTLIEWKNTPITGQIQITKTSAEYNTMNGWPEGTPLPGTEFEIYEHRTGNLVETVKTDKNGVASSKPLPLGRYKVVESKAADFYGLDKTPIEAEIEFSGQIVWVAMTNKSLYTNVSITKRGYSEVVPGQSIRYDFSNIANNSTSALTSFYWRDTLPTQAVRLDKIITGTYNVKGNYKIVYKTNLSGSTYRTLVDNVSTQQNKVYAASPAALGLASNECVTEFICVFGVVPGNFRQVEAPQVYCKVLSGLAGGTQFSNQADVGGMYGKQWIMATDRWVTSVYAKEKSLPRTGY